MEIKDSSPDSPYLTDNLLARYPQELSVLLSTAELKKYGIGQVIYRQKERSRPQFYLIESGRVKISILSEVGSEKIIAIQERNTFFGEASALDGNPYFATATTLEPTRLQIIKVQDFLNLVRIHPEIASMMIWALTRVVRMLVFQIEDFSFLDAQKRVAHMVFKLMCEVGEKTAEGVIIRKKVTHEELASLTGLSRVSVTLALNKFEKLRILRKKRHTIEVTDIEGLQGIIGQ